MVNHFPILAVNPFFEAYLQADFLGKGIFIFLFFISLFSWSLIVYKLKNLYEIEKTSKQFQEIFKKCRKSPLMIDEALFNLETKKSPFYLLYQVLKQEAKILLEKRGRVKHDKQYGDNLSKAVPELSNDDLKTIENRLFFEINRQIQKLEEYLFTLSTIVSLAPFLGLLGTVWGILTSFSQMSLGASSSNQLILSGLSLALATTVLGLIDAIPALVGYNFFKHKFVQKREEMEQFSNDLLSTLEFCYKRVD